MTDASPSLNRSRSGPLGDGFDLGRLLLEGRAYFALIVIVVGLLDPVALLPVARATS